MAVLLALLLVAAFALGMRGGWMLRTWLADAPRLRSELAQVRAERDLDRVARQAALDMLSATVGNPDVMAQRRD